jgi:predicted nicotinamide N-methyase
LTQNWDPIATPLSGSNPTVGRSFVTANTHLVAPPLVPELRLHLAVESLAIWQKTEDELGAAHVPPPFWAFAWAGGQALARYLLDHPAVVSSRRVVDIGTGSGLAALAARRAGAAHVLAADIDPLACIAARLNAEANGLEADLEITSRDLLAAAPVAVETILIGDVFYERPLAQRVLTYLEAATATGIVCLVGDPQRSYFPKDRFVEVARYSVPVTRDLEDSEIKNTAVWRFVA